MKTSITKLMDQEISQLDPLKETLKPLYYKTKHKIDQKNLILEKQKKSISSPKVELISNQIHPPSTQFSSRMLDFNNTPNIERTHQKHDSWNSSIIKQPLEKSSFLNGISSIQQSKEMENQAIYTGRRQNSNNTYKISMQSQKDSQQSQIPIENNENQQLNELNISSTLRSISRRSIMQNVKSVSPNGSSNDSQNSRYQEIHSVNNSKNSSLSNGLGMQVRGILKKGSCSLRNSVSDVQSENSQFSNGSQRKVRFSVDQSCGMIRNLIRDCNQKQF